MKIYIKPSYKIIIVLVTLLAASIACNISGPEPPEETIVPSKDALDSFNNKWRDLSMVTPNGPFSITFTEQELTSAVANAIETAEADSNQQIPLNNVQVLLRNGTVKIYGQAILNPLNVNGMIELTPSIGENGNVQLEVNRIEFGALELDETLLDSLIDIVEQTINEPIQSSPLQIKLDNLTVENKDMTISGTIGL